MGDRTLKPNNIKKLILAVPLEARPYVVAAFRHIIQLTARRRPKRPTIPLP